MLTILLRIFVWFSLTRLRCGKLTSILRTSRKYGNSAASMLRRCSKSRSDSSSFFNTRTSWTWMHASGTAAYDATMSNKRSKSDKSTMA
ncbi:hypothetical protein BC940DRAFT_288867 [Gongronella butleri]|nr:hypothetical protein BC940DRAFT_288867 [Gongronella butleri]